MEETKIKNCLCGSDNVSTVTLDRTNKSGFYYYQITLKCCDCGFTVSRKFYKPNFANIQRDYESVVELWNKGK